MEWFSNLFIGSNIAQIILVFSITIAIGILLGKIKIFGISLGITWILFTGIFLSHWGMRIEHHTLHFIKEFGLILFVYSVGLQVGPGFFSVFKKGGIRLNMLALTIVLLGVTTTYIIYLVTGLPITTMVGILSGAVTNTPGLGAAQQTYEDISGGADPTIAMGYAVAYPLGVIGIILAILLIRFIFRINMEKETEMCENDTEKKEKLATKLSVVVKNPALFGKKIVEIASLLDRKFVISRVLHPKGEMEIAGSHTVLNEGDRLLIITSQKDTRAITVFIGEEIEMGGDVWEKMENSLISRRIMITRAELNGKMLGGLHLREAFNVNITRVNRSGVDLVANRNLLLQMGDRLTVVGTEDAVESVEKIMGNSLKRLREPNLVTIFVGIALGVILGSLPMLLPGIPQPIKLGLAGGPLIIAILISRFGPRYGLITYTTMSANLMLREVGISLFLAAVGLSAGEGFVDTVVNGGGYMWIIYGFLITLIPLLIVGIMARSLYKMNYYTLMGLLAGSMTDPPALAYSVAQAPNDFPAVSYSTVYPLTMFLRVLTPQLLILFLL